MVKIKQKIFKKNLQKMLDNLGGDIIGLDKNKGGAKICLNQGEDSH